jgi:hypothetical protein
MKATSLNHVDVLLYCWWRRHHGHFRWVALSVPVDGKAVCDGVAAGE